MTSPEGTLPALTGSGFDRAAAERGADDLLETLRADAATRVLVVHGDAAPLDSPDSLMYVQPDDAPAGAQWAFLGRAADGAPVVAAVTSGRGMDEPFAASAGWGSLRAVGGGLAADDAGAFVEALSLGRWLLDAPHCPACGALTEVRQAGWARLCPDCGREHFPRTDPAVIVAITSAQDPDLLLLGSNALWEANRFSCFAGFVEAGESLETAVVREMREEAGVDVMNVRYRGSQAWPYPRSLMVGFLATSADDGQAKADGEEIVALRWFHRDEVGAALVGEGDRLLPGRASIAHRLISDWHADTA